MSGMERVSMTAFGKDVIATATMVFPADKKF
jgi:hypothetical protein